MPLNRRRVLGSVALLALSSLAASAANRIPGVRTTASPLPTRPNIILLLTDDLDQRLGTLDHMPTLRRLLQEPGITFTNCVASTPVCCPSRTSILRGQYARNHGIYRNSYPAGGYAKVVETGLEASTLATALQGVGYRTSYIGKYLNGYPLPDARSHVPPGWDEWVSPVTGSAYRSYNYTLNVNGVLVPHGSAPEDYITDVLGRYAADSIAAASSSGVPFYLQLATYAPHKPATSAPRHAGMFPDLAIPRTPSFNEEDVSDKHSDGARLAPLSPTRIERMDELYRQRLRSMQAVDEMIGGLVQALERTGQLQNTYLVVTSDNGFHMGQHRLPDGKGTHYEEDIVVPLIVRGPGVSAGRAVDALTNLIDLMPTFLELAGATVPDYVDGRSLVPYLMGNPPTRWRRAVLIESYWSDPNLTPTASHRRKRQADSAEDPEATQEASAPLDRGADATDAPPTRDFIGLRGRDFKYVEFASGETEVYDLARDPYELECSSTIAETASTRALHMWLSALSSCPSGACSSLEDNPPVPRKNWLPVVG